METSVTLSENANGETGFFDSVLNIPAWLFGTAIVGTAAIAGTVTYLITGGPDKIKGEVELPKTLPDDLKPQVKASVADLTKAVLDITEKCPHSYRDSLVRLLMDDWSNILATVMPPIMMPASLNTPKFNALAIPLGIGRATITEAVERNYVALKDVVLKAAEDNNSIPMDQIEKARELLGKYRHSAQTAANAAGAASAAPNNKQAAA